MKHFIGAALILLGLASCEKEEKPVAPATSQALTAGFGSDYSNMLYFDVLSGLFVKELPHFGYDLQLETTPEGKHIYLNGSNFMFVRNRGQVAFESVTDTSGIGPWLYDYPTGQPNRTAFGTWFNADGTTKNEVFVLNRGFDKNGNNIGFLKLMVLGVTPTTYQLRIGSLDNALDTVVTLQKNDEKALMQVSLNSFAEEDIDPNKNDWHLHFTQYTDYDITDQGDTIPYLVRGVLSNTTTTEAVKLEGVAWEEIDLAYAQSQTYSSARNAIGFNWKAFSLTSGIYEVLPDVSYIIRERSGNYYKLRFVDYYNDSGEVGYAKFEIIGL